VLVFYYQRFRNEFEVRERITVFSLHAYMYIKCMD